VLSVGEPSREGGFPVSLTFWDTTSGPRPGGEPPVAVASGKIPVSFDRPDPPLDVRDGESVGEAIRRLLVGSARPRGSDVRALATWLHALLDEAGVGEELRRRRDAVARDADPGTGLRLYLDIRAAEVRYLPWELMFDGDRRWPFGELANPGARITRNYRDQGQPSDWYWPIRVLVVVGCAGDDEQMLAEREVAQLRDTLARHCAEADVEVVRRPLRRQLLRKLEERRPHVLHLIGRSETSSSGEGRFVVELDETHRPLRRWFWRASHIDADLDRLPRVVVLNCCRTNLTSDQHGSWQMADAFAERGVPAVISMQGPIESGDAVAFGSAFYRALTQGERAHFDVAVTAGRRAITAKNDGWDRREMCYPALILNRPPDQVLPPRWLPGPQIRDRVHRLEAENKPTLLDRRRYRRDLLEQLDLTGGDAGYDVLPPRLIAITGPESIGKSALARWVIARQVQRGRQAAYVDLGGRRHGWLEVLQRLCAEVGEAANDPTPLTSFQRSLDDTIAAARERASGEAGAPLDLDVTEISGAFVRALRATAGDDTLIVALDPLDIGDAGPAAPVIPDIVSRIDAGDANDTRLLLVRRGSSGDRPPRGLSRLFTLTVDPFDTDPNEVEWMWRQFLVVTHDDDDQVETLLPAVSGIPIRDGAPGPILNLFQSVERIASAR
jgi:hypothetical protein